MNVLINYKKKPSTNRFANLIFFVDEKFNLQHIKKYISIKDYLYVSDLLKTFDLKKKVISFDVHSKKKNYFSFFKQ